MYICIYVYIYIYTHTHMYRYIYMYNICTHTYILRYMYRKIHTSDNNLQHTATYCNTMQHTATHCITPQHAGPSNGPPKELLVPYPHLASRCNILQHCNTLQNCATICNTMHPTDGTKRAVKRATSSTFSSDIKLQNIAPL